jgi:MFS transporter, SP family, xylose:H+ symportor
MFGISCLPSLIQLFFLVIGYIPESPYSLIIKNRRDEARDVLSLYYKEEFVDKILEEKDKLYAKTEAQEEEESRVVWTKKGIYLGFQLSIFQVLTGIASYVTQAGHVISVALQEPIFGLYTPILITIAQLIGTFISIPMLKYIEWRYLTIIGGFALVFWQTLSGLFFYLHQNSESFRPFSMTLCMVVIMCFMFTFGITVGSSVWPYISCTMSSRPILYAQILNWLLAGCSIMAFSFNVDSKGSPWIIIWVYTGITLVLTVLNCIFMVDIKGLSIRKVQIKLAED